MPLYVIGDESGCQEVHSFMSSSFVYIQINYILISLFQYVPNIMGSNPIFKIKLDCLICLAYSNMTLVNFILSLAFCLFTSLASSNFGHI